MEPDIKGPSSVISHLLSQVRTTRVNTGHCQGYYISQAQVAAIQQVADDLAGSASTAPTPTHSPTPEEQQLHSSIEDVQTQIDSLTLARSTLNLTLVTASPQRRVAVNHELGRFDSEIARHKRNLEKLRALLPE